MVETRAPLFLGTVIVSSLLALVVVVMRISYRWNKRCLIHSDYMIIIAMISSLMHLALDITITTGYGYGQHELDLPANLRNSHKTGIIFWLIQIITKLPLLFSKVSVCLVYRELFRTADTNIIRVSRAVNYFTMGLVISFFTAVTLVSAFSCIPIQKIWYPKIAGKCINNNTLLYVTSAINILTSVLVICTPLPVLLRTRHKRIEIKQLIALVLLGIGDTGVSCWRLYMLGTMKNQKLDFTWIIIPAHIAIVLEYNITIIAASLVVMRPCFQAIYTFLFPNSIYASSTNRTGGYTGYAKDANRSRKHERITDTDVGVEDRKKIRIVKTVEIEMSSRCESTESILGITSTHRQQQ